MTPNIDSIIRDHVTLTVRCLDRIYLQGYMPKLQTSGGLCYFLRDHLGHPIPSPALFRPIHDRFVNGITAYAAEHAVPLVPFEAGQDKDAIVAGYRAKFTAQEGVVIVGVAQEKMRSFKAHKRCGPGTAVTFDFTRQPVSVNHYYFYLHDRAWGPAFIKIGTYLPYPIKICLNGHEWVKQQLRHAQIPFVSLDNGFLSCADPVRLQAICDHLGPRDIQQFFDRWSRRLPWPMRPEDRAAGFDHRVTLCQLETVLQAVSADVRRDLGTSHDFESLPPPRNLSNVENYLQRAEWQYYKTSARQDDLLALVTYAQHDARYLRGVSRTSRKLQDLDVINHNLPMVLLFREALRIEHGDKKKAVGLLDEAIRIPYAWIKSVPREALPASLALDNFLLPGNKEDGADKSRHWNVFGGICLYKSPQEAVDLALKREMQDLRDGHYSEEAMREFFRDMIGDLNGMYEVMSVNPDLLAHRR